MPISKSVLLIFSILLIPFTYAHSQQHVERNTDTTIVIATSGNSWVVNDPFQSSEVISSDGITNWTNQDQIIRTYFYVDKPGQISLSLKIKTEKGSSVIKVGVGDFSKNIIINNAEFEQIDIGNFEVHSAGYHFIELKGLEKEGNTFADVMEIKLTYDSSKNAIKYIADDFYFGRRGPSTHLLFQTPPEIDDIEWFYNEIEIDENQDAIGSYFMACGFTGGYFGIQVNSETERRILFSIWSPYNTDDPKSIPEEYRIKLLSKGDGVTTGEFGDEGSGGQSYKIFPWNVKTRYKFIISAKPTDNESTDYTAYFCDPKEGTWNLIASFRKPKTHSYLTRLYSFLENFIPETGIISRQGGFYNQWIRDSKGKWHEINEARFSADATAKKGSRLDYSGGIKNDGFYLKNCGFTNDHLKIGTPLKRPQNGTSPSVNINELDKINNSHKIQ
ncbi:MAG: DUF3472 domain-containing protein [Bacteroidetes bacterium]|nr:DUF3472 domain-containing protein [Bacteroidota bacterium]